MSKGDFFEWKIKVPIFKNRLILKQLGLGIGIPFGVLIIIMLIIKAYYGVLLIGLTLLLTAILVMFVFKGTYDVHFVINEKGILCKSQSKQEKRVKKLSAITVIMGFFAGNLTAVGAGMLSGARTKVFIPWKRIRKIKNLEKQKCFLIFGRFSENMAVFCTNDNYEEVKKIIAEKQS